MGFLRWLKALFGGEDGAAPPPTAKSGKLSATEPEPRPEPDYTGWGNDIDLDHDRPFRRGPDGRVNTRH